MIASEVKVKQKSIKINLFQLRLVCNYLLGCLFFLLSSVANS